MNNLEKMYTFLDIIIFRKTEQGYVCLTDFSFDSFCFKPQSFFPFNEQSNYVLGLWTKKGYIITPVSYDDLFILSNTKGESAFINQCRCHIEPTTADDILATMLANKISNYNYGKVTLKEDCSGIIYQFARRNIVNNRRTYPVILEKRFTHAVTKGNE